MCIVGQQWHSCGHYRRKYILECFSFQLGEPCKGIKYNEPYNLENEDCIMCKVIPDLDEVAAQCAAADSHARELALAAQAAGFASRDASSALRIARSISRHQATDCQICKAQKDVETCEARAEDAKKRAEAAERAAGVQAIRGKIARGQFEFFREVLAFERAEFAAEYEEKTGGRPEFEAERAREEEDKAEMERLRLRMQQDRGHWL